MMVLLPLRQYMILGLQKQSASKPFTQFVHFTGSPLHTINQLDIRTLKSRKVLECCFDICVQNAHKTQNAIGSYCCHGQIGKQLLISSLHIHGTQSLISVLVFIGPLTVPALAYRLCVEELNPHAYGMPGRPAADIINVPLLHRMYFIRAILYVLA